MIDLTARRITWSALTRAEIEQVIIDAGQHGDTALVARARRALARR